MAGAPPSPHPAFISAERSVAGAPLNWIGARMATARAVCWPGGPVAVQGGPATRGPRW